MISCLCFVALFEFLPLFLRSYSQSTSRALVDVFLPRLFVSLLGLTFTELRLLMAPRSSLLFTLPLSLFLAMMFSAIVWLTMFRYAFLLSRPSTSSVSFRSRCCRYKTSFSIVSNAHVIYSQVPKLSIYLTLFVVLVFNICKIFYISPYDNEEPDGPITVDLDTSTIFPLIRSSQNYGFMAYIDIELSGIWLYVEHFSRKWSD